MHGYDGMSEQPRVIVCKKLTEIPAGVSLWMYSVPAGLDAAKALHAKKRPMPEVIYQVGNIFYFPEVRA